jgi:uncharacterized protein YjbJ (UPF0337 family)
MMTDRQFAACTRKIQMTAGLGQWHVNCEPFHDTDETSSDGGDAGRVSVFQNHGTNQEWTMLTQQEIAGHWNELRGRIEQRWGQLSGNDLDVINGDVDRLVGTIQQKTGQARDRIEAELEQLSEGVCDVTSKAADGLGGYAKQASRYAEKARDAVVDQYTTSSRR